MFKKLDILNLEWPSGDRDLNITTPILIYLNKKYELSYKTKSIHNGFFYLLLCRPKILLMSNTQGAVINHNIATIASNIGIKVVSLISEGNVVDEDAEQFLWGHNKKKKFFIEKLLVWSERSRKLFINKFPNLQDHIITVGASGFDRYKLLNFISKDDFLKENNLTRYKKIIGIAAWGFDLLFGEYYENNKEHFLKIWGQDQIDMHKADLVKLNSIYKNLIENNKDILFILRYHPGNIDFTRNEFCNLDKYENVFVSNRYENNEYRISDLINVSDLWIGYETTTSLESWLLNKQTFLINPTKIDFVREMTYKGSPIVQNYSGAQQYIEEYFNNNTINDFEQLESLRVEVIKEVIGYGDGKSYIRAAEEVIKVFNKSDKDIKYDFKIYKEAFKQILKLILSKTILRDRWSNLKYKSDFAKRYQKMYENAIDV